MTARGEISILLVIFLPPLCAVINATFSRECGEKNLIGRHGILTSPNYPNQYPENTNCSWFLKIPRNSTATIVITNFDIEEEEGQCRTGGCCENNALTISNKKLCGKENFPRRVLSTDDVAIRISFTTAKNPQRRKGFRLILSLQNKTLCEGYDLSCLDEGGCYNIGDICDSRQNCADHSDETNCAKCEDNHAACNNYSSFCLDPFNERCDGIHHCPKGEDELDCPEICPQKIRCADGRGCYSQNQICDHRSDCSDGSDELDCGQKLCGKASKEEAYFLCSNGKCIDAQLVENGSDDCGDQSDEFKKPEVNLVALVTFSAITLTMVFFVLICRWYKTRRSINVFMQDFPQFPLPPFRGPGEANHAVCSIQFSQSDFLHGGAIYEAFVRARRRLGPERTRHATSLTTQVERQLFRNHGPSCALSALASLGITSDSCLSSNELFGECEKSCDYCQKTSRESKGFSNTTATSDERKHSDTENTEKRHPTYKYVTV